MSPIKTMKKYWRSFSDLQKTESYKQFLHREFPEGASELTDESKRSFIKLLGATTAFAGLTGCSIRRPKQFIKPYAKMPEYVVPGKSMFYATALAIDEDVVGLLGETYEGRPTKLEGNPDHPQSLGAAKSFHQASILNLYDPDRVLSISKDGEHKSIEEFESWVQSYQAELKKTKGKGLGILTETSVSPTFHRVVDAFQKRYPLAQVERYSPVNRDSQTRALNKLYGEYLAPNYFYDKADVIVSFDCDFLGTEPGSVLASKQFSSRRDPEEGTLNRLYSFENTFTLTGAKADHRYRLKSSDVAGAVAYIAQKVFQTRRFDIPSKMADQLQKAASAAVKGSLKNVLPIIAEDVLAKGSRALLVAGSDQPSGVHAVVALANQALKSVGTTLIYKELPLRSSSLVTSSSVDSISRLASNIKRGKIDSLIILGGNPALDAPSDLEFKSLIGKVETTLHLTDQNNDTSSEAQWVVPQSHYLESWGDVISLDGTSSIVQPLIQPMGESYTLSEFLSLLQGKTKNGYALVRQTWRSSTSSFESSWDKWLHSGLIKKNTAVVRPQPVGGKALFDDVLAAFPGTLFNSQLEVVFKPDASVYDGRFVNNGWLQEMPDPITKLTWDNAALLSPATARTLNVKTEDVVTINTRHGKVKTPVYVLPGHADQSITLSLGYGQSASGRIGSDVGVNTYAIRSSEEMTAINSVTLIKSNETHSLASTQDHGSLEGRPIYREASVEEYAEHPTFAKEMVETPPLKSLYQEISYDTGYQWGLAIDLSKCTGCNACVVGCQSENNIPIVGKDEVLNGREMHWIRIDRYFEGDEDNPTVVEQPMTCLQCELAPCEQVCPVAATVHSEDGLNDMVYNRCVGTRYCADNCPVKVRRFNFFDYHQRNPQSQPKEREHFFDYMREPDKSVQKQFNPDVTVRMRGVMEKCTYCVQRISKAKINADNEGRLLKDGEIVTACQQTCSADAIVFGDINDPNSKVSKLKKRNRDYHILEQLHLKPRTSFLASIRNPNPKLKSKKTKVGSHHG